MARYALADHVFVCLNGEHLVLLDLKADRYWALEAAQTAGFGSLVGGWPVNARDGMHDEQPSAQTAETIDQLRGRGLLTEGVRYGKDATPISAIAPARELSMQPGAQARSGSWLKFLAASLTARIALRMGAFERVIGRVRERKARLGPKAALLNVELARAQVDAFMNYRVFLFSVKDECLFDSLALLEYLARFDVYADWVFGVQTRPFAAHCWVQHGDIVFNDTVEHVSGYTPIMVV